MPQGSRKQWLRATVASVGVTLCLGALGCNNTPDKPRSPTGAGLPGTPTLPSGSAAGGYGSTGAMPATGSSLPGSTVPNRSALPSSQFPTTAPSYQSGMNTGSYPSSGSTPGSTFSTGNTGYSGMGGSGTMNPAAGMGGGIQPNTAMSGATATPARPASTFGSSMTTTGGANVPAIPGMTSPGASNPWPSTPDIYPPQPPTR